MWHGAPTICFVERAMEVRSTSTVEGYGKVCKVVESPDWSVAVVLHLKKYNEMINVNR